MFARLAPLVAAALVVAACAGPQHARGPGAGGGAGPGRSGVPSAAASWPAGTARTAVVDRTVDGDTFWLRGLAAEAVKVRVIGIDTPELRPAECWGREAAAWARRTLPDGARIIVRAGRERADRYGRLLLHLETPAGRSYAEEALRGGHATAYLVRPEPAFARGMLAAERAARGAGRGLWGACSRVVPSSRAWTRRSRPGSTTPRTGPRSPRSPPG